MLKLEHAHAHNASQPLLCLPDEIISQILQDDLPHPWSTWPRRPSSSHIAPTIGYNKQFLTMNAVCRKLRSVALNSPRCWTNIVIRMSDIKSPIPNAILASFLERSKGCQFDLVLQLRQYYLNPYELRDVLEVLHPHIHTSTDVAA